jgi:death on curing protein
VSDQPADVDYSDLEDLLEIAAGVVDGPVVRDLGLLASAAARPPMSAFGADAYPTFAEKVGALVESIVRNHALVDGNKRLGWSAARVFCLMNGRDLDYSVDDAEALIIAVAEGKLDVATIARSVEAHLA